MGFEFNLIKNEGNLFNLTTELQSKLLQNLYFLPHLALIINIIANWLSNSEKFPLHDGLQKFKSSFGGDWLIFFRELEGIFALTAIIIFLLTLPVLLTNRFYVYEESNPFYKIWVNFLRFYYYTSAIYLNYLIFSMQSFDELLNRNDVKFADVKFAIILVFTFILMVAPPIVGIRNRLLVMWKNNL